MKSKFDIPKPKNPKKKSNEKLQSTAMETKTPAGSKLSDSELSATIQLRVTPAKRHEIKMFALERNMTVKELLISLYEMEKLR